MTKKGFEKGKYEESIEEAKDLLNDGIGMEEIAELTSLDEEDIKKAQDKMSKKINDKKLNDKRLRGK